MLAALLLIIIGMIFCTSIIGAIIGLPLILLGLFLIFVNIFGSVTRGAVELVTLAVKNETTKSCPYCFESIDNKSLRCKYCSADLIAISSEGDVSENGKKPLITESERILSNDAYKIYLVREYQIEVNNTFQKYIFNNKLFDSLDLALTAAQLYDVELNTRLIEEDKIKKNIDKLKSEEIIRELSDKEMEGICPKCEELLHIDARICLSCETVFGELNDLKPVSKAQFILSRQFDY